MYPTVKYHYLFVSLGSSVSKMSAPRPGGMEFDPGLHPNKVVKVVYSGGVLHLDLTLNGRH